jgi:hypothetical protein
VSLVLHFSASRARNVDVLFFMHTWDRYGFDKNHAGTRYTKFVFFFASGEICGSCSAFRCVPMQNIDVVLFMLGWPLCGFHKKCVGTRYAKLEFLHLVGSAGHVV